MLQFRLAKTGNGDTFEWRGGLLDDSPTWRTRGVERKKERERDREKERRRDG